jgi:hypothetical protein
MRVERSAAREKSKYKKLELATPYTAQQLDEIARIYAQEQCRGAEPLYFEDVAIGQALPQIVRGPYNATTAVAFEQGWGGLFIKAHGYWFDYLRRHPAAGAGGLIPGNAARSAAAAIRARRLAVRLDVPIPSAVSIGISRADSGRNGAESPRSIRDARASELAPRCPARWQAPCGRKSLLKGCWQGL